jgi:hypothetical protein
MVEGGVDLKLIKEGNEKRQSGGLKTRDKT